MSNAYPIATPEEAAKFTKELHRPYQCPVCQYPIGGTVDPKTKQRIFCSHRKEAAKLPEANGKSRPWGFKGTMKLPKNPVQWINRTPRDWRMVAIQECRGGFAVVLAGSFVGITPHTLNLAHLDPFSPTTATTLQEALELGVCMEKAFREHFKWKFIK